MVLGECKGRIKGNIKTSLPFHCLGHACCCMTCETQQRIWPMIPFFSETLAARFIPVVTLLNLWDEFDSRTLLYEDNMLKHPSASIQRQDTPCPTS